MTKCLTHRYPIAFRHCRCLLIAVWASWLIPAAALAQTKSRPSAALEGIPPSPTVVSQPAQSLPISTPITVRSPYDPDYWIVSTRHAKLEVENGQGCAYEVTRFDGPNARCSSVDELQASLQPGVPVCLMIHGSFVTYESMLADSARTYRWLREAAPCQPVHIVFYTWASDDECLFPHVYVNSLGRRASLNGFYLADVVSKISPDHPVCLIGHSHGTRMVAAALHAMAGGDVERRLFANGPQPPRRIRAVLAAAAIDHNWLNPNERYGLALCQAEAVLNLRNCADFPLLFYPLRRPISAPSLAITGLTRQDRREMACWNPKIIDYDVTHSVGLGHIWIHYCNHPEIATAIRHYVYFDEPTLPAR